MPDQASPGLVIQEALDSDAMNTPEHPQLSVAMSVYNGERFLAEAIESVLVQTFTQFEFLIVDDGSQDGTRDIIADYAAKTGDWCTA
jgi:cellulose synthase/poly-beta-1,6-N-acetylglucosamine synthase-like glycosyltransferase